MYSLERTFIWLEQNYLKFRCKLYKTVSAVVIKNLSGKLLVAQTTLLQKYLLHIEFIPLYLIFLTLPVPMPDEEKKLS